MVATLQRPPDIITRGFNLLLRRLDSTYMIARRAHWNVTGPNFKSLHILFEEVYKSLAEWQDRLAEHMRFVVSTPAGAVQTETQWMVGTMLPLNIWPSTSNDWVLTVGRELNSTDKELREFTKVLKDSPQRVRELAPTMNLLEEFAVEVGKWMWQVGASEINPRD